MNRHAILATVTAATLATLPAARLQAQAPPAADPNRPAFEVASIKRNVSGSDNASIRALPGGRVVVHTEMRDTPVFALVIARSDGQLGLQLRRSSVDCAALFAAAQTRKEALPNTVNGRPACGTQINAGIMMTTGTTMADLARSLSALAGRSVVDKTGLTGSFDLDLTWAPDQIAQPDGPGATPRAVSDSPSLVTAVQEQLGLKLDSQRAPIETLVIDSAERPTGD